jgi:hypothetical protein
LSIVKGFRFGDKEDLNKIKLAYECLIYPKFYEQLGKDTAAAVSEGIELLKMLYGQAED